MKKRFRRQMKGFQKISEAIDLLLKRLSKLRLVVFSLMLLFLFLAIYNLLYLLGVLPVLIFFIALIRRYNALKEKRSHILRKMTFIEENMKRLEANQSSISIPSFPLDEDLIYLRDLNIIGESSFLEFIYYRSSPYALTNLEKRFKGLNSIRIEEIKEEQNRIEEFSKRAFRRLSLYALANEINWEEEDLSAFEGWLKQDQKLSQKSFYWRYLSFLFLANIFISAWMDLLIPVVAQFFIHLVIVQVFSVKWTAEYKDALSSEKRFLVFSKLFQFIDLAYSHFLEKKGKPKAGISKAFLDFQILNDRLSLIYSGMGYVLLNALCFWDLWYLPSLFRWKESYRNEIPQYLNLLGEIESREILANFAYLNPNYCKVEFKKGEINAQNFAHPLIPEKHVVANSIELKKGQIVLVSGSNMSGKTTFLRSLGINLVLAYLGLPVNAKSFSVDKFHLETSLNVLDSLSDGVSFFYAELKRLKRIIEAAKKEENCIYFIDEMLKGTNAKERSEASLNVLKQFAETDAIGLFSTHDLELTRLEKEFPKQIRNIHFSEVDDPNQLKFDYKLKEGPVRSSNAIRILKQEGLYKT